jgi:hypothetical protein
MELNEMFACYCNSEWGCLHIGPINLIWQNSAGQYAYFQHRQWGNTILIIGEREFSFH